MHIHRRTDEEEIARQSYRQAVSRQRQKTDRKGNRKRESEIRWEKRKGESESLKRYAKVWFAVIHDRAIQ